MKKFQNKYRISSARLASWDYSWPGFYFITICTKDRKHFFGTIKNGEMFLNEIGRIANECWKQIPHHFKNSTLGEFVIMPNHVHGIIIINPVETGHALSRFHSPQAIENNSPAANDDSPAANNDLPAANETGHALSLRKKTISDMVGSFKSAVTKLSKSTNTEFGWQTRFHDHIIRSHDDYERISNYITNNISNWEKDKFYK